MIREGLKQMAVLWVGVDGADEWIVPSRSVEPLNPAQAEVSVLLERRASSGEVRRVEVAEECDSGTHGQEERAVLALWLPYVRPPTS